MVKERKTADEDEVESLMHEVQDNDHGSNSSSSSSSSNNNNKASGMKETTNKGSSTTWKVVALILVGLVVLFATDSIEIKRTNDGSLTQGNVEQRFPDDEEGSSGSGTVATPSDGTVDVDKQAPAADKKAPAAEKNKGKEKKKDDKPMVYENETPRYAYKTRGQPMPDALAKEQTSKWGEWKPMTKERPQHDFYKDYPNRDVPRAKFPSNAWQLDKVYMKEFLTQGKDLVMRAMEAILAEYGHSVDDEPGVSFDDRSAMFNLRRLNLTETKFDKKGGIDGQDGGWTTDRSWEGLKRRLLHAIMTEDSFNFAMAGHSASAGHGNHFTQSYSLQVAWIVEPIFARLGVKHQSRNFGNGGLGTQHNAFAGGSLFGPDVDMLMWDSGMTEGGHRDPDLMIRQGMIGGLKVPLLLSFGHGLLVPYHEKADVDVIMNGDNPSRGGVPQQDTLEDIDKAVWASKFLKCGPDLKAHCRANEYNGTCWIERPDYTPTTNQNPEPGGRAGWHPGNRIHQIRGRTMAMTILSALHEALTMWSESGSEADAYKLEDAVWHLTEYYENQRTKVQALDPDVTGCGAFEKDHGMGWVCKVPLKGRSEFGPRAYAGLTSLRTIMPTAMKEIIGEPPQNVYEAPDVFNPTIHPPLGEIDVLNIVEAGPEFKSVMDPQIYKDFYETPKDDSIILKPGKGNSLQVVPGADRCDGTIDSWCSRGAGNNCLMYGHNDFRLGVMMDGYSGWLIFKPLLKLGYIAVKVETWHFPEENPKTDGWKSINNETEGGRQLLGHKMRGDDLTSHNAAASAQPSRRGLKRAVNPYCDDFHFEYAIDGKITSLNLTEFQAAYQHTQRVVEVVPLLQDPDYFGGKEREVEVAVRMTGCQKIKLFKLTHIYYA